MYCIHTKDAGVTEVRQCKKLLQVVLNGSASEHHATCY